ncbi:MAG TPA: alanine racemase [Thermoanaerobaculia bacterium]|nr:alanine racemase [Thermoanaerobaculia bacterium]
MTFPLRPTRAVVDLDALASNYRALGTGLPEGCTVLPVVKADAYGHGAVHVSRRLAKEGATTLAVAVVEEGLELRRAGITQRILVMGWIGKDQIGALVEGGLTPNVHSIEQAEELKNFLEGEEGRGVSLAVHLKLDTGMTRLGLRPEELPRALDLLERLKSRVVVEGVFQNFATAYDVNSEQNEDQARIFLEGVKTIRAAGHRPSMVHTDNSGATLARTGRTAPSPSSPSKKSLSSVVTHVRPGLALYARVPEVPSVAGETLQDIMSLVSVVDQVKTVPAGTKVGYAGTFVCGRTTTLAIVPAGYADGIRRHLAGRGQVLIGGRRCPIAGRISMDLTEVDVTDLPSPPVRGDEAVFFGAQGAERIGVGEVADAADTVAWEILCGIGPRVPRVAVEGGREVARVTRFP